MKRDGLVSGIRLVCPLCRKPRKGGIEAHELSVSSVLDESGDDVNFGFLACPKCKAEYPIIEGMPCVMRGAREWLGGELAASPNPPELPEGMADYQVRPESVRSGQEEGRLVDAFMELHYGFLFPTRASRPEWSHNKGYWESVIGLASGAPGPVLDLGCSVGRMSFEATKGAAVVGVDLRLESLRAASRVARSGSISFSRKLGGRLVEELSATYSPPGEPVFIAADALDPPFLPGSFGTVAALNLLDNVSNPMVLLGQMDALLKPGGKMVIGSPYEWREDITPASQWLSSPDMDSADMVRGLLEGWHIPESGLRYSIEEDISELGWTMRNHDRYYSHFISHVIRARKL